VLRFKAELLLFAAAAVALPTLLTFFDDSDFSLDARLAITSNCSISALIDWGESGKGRFPRGRCFCSVGCDVSFSLSLFERSDVVIFRGFPLAAVWIGIKPGPNFSGDTASDKAPGPFFESFDNSMGEKFMGFE